MQPGAEGIFQRAPEKAERLTLGRNSPILGREYGRRKRKQGFPLKQNVRKGDNYGRKYRRRKEDTISGGGFF